MIQDLYYAEICFKMAFFMVDPLVEETSGCSFAQLLRIASNNLADPHHHDSILTKQAHFYLHALIDPLPCTRILPKGNIFMKLAS